MECEDIQGNVMSQKAFEERLLRALKTAKKTAKIDEKSMVLAVFSMFLVAFETRKACVWWFSDRICGDRA